MKKGQGMVRKHSLLPLPQIHNCCQPCFDFTLLLGKMIPSNHAHKHSSPSLPGYPRLYQDMSCLRKSRKCCLPVKMHKPVSCSANATQRGSYIKHIPHSDRSPVACMSGLAQFVRSSTQPGNATWDPSDWGNPYAIMLPLHIW